MTGDKDLTACRRLIAEHERLCHRGPSSLPVKMVTKWGSITGSRRGVSTVVGILAAVFVIWIMFRR